MFRPSKHRLSRRRVLATSLSTLAALAVIPAIPISAAPQTQLNALTIKALDQHLRSLPAASIATDQTPAGASQRGWALDMQGPPGLFRVTAETDQAGIITRLEGISTGFLSGAFIQDLAGLSLAGSNPGLAGQWARASYEAGFDRWPNERTYGETIGQWQYTMTGSFNSNGIRTQLTIAPRTS